MSTIETVIAIVLALVSQTEPIQFLGQVHPLSLSPAFTTNYAIVNGP